MTLRRVSCLACAIALASACGSSRHTVEVSVNRGMDGVVLGMTRQEVRAATGAAVGSAPVVTTRRSIVVEFDASGHVASLHVRGGPACLVRPHVCIGDPGGARKAADAFGNAARALDEDLQTMVVIRGRYRGRKATTMLWYSAPGSPPPAADDEGAGAPRTKVPAKATIRAIDLYVAE